MLNLACLLFLFFLTMIASNTDHKTKIIKIQFSDWMSCILVEWKTNPFGVRKMYSEQSSVVGGKTSLSPVAAWCHSLCISMTAYCRLDD